MLEASGSLRLLYDLGSAFAARLRIEELIPLVVTRCREVLDVEGVAVLLCDADRRTLSFPYAADEDPDVAGLLAGFSVPADRGIAGAVLESGRALRIDDAPRDPRFNPDVDRHTGIATRSILSAPLVTQRRTIGVIQAVNPRGRRAFTDEELELLTVLAGSIAVAIENAQLWSQMQASAEQLRAQVGAMRRDLARRERFVDIVGRSAAMLEVFRLMESAATSPISVLLEGETGTGKELVARAIHCAGPRADAPFVAINCAALPEALLESELFGHRRGAFTGATRDQPGFFEAASGGTVFLDEIAEMPIAMQAKLLRVLQEGEVTPVGDRHPRKVDVRIISATNRNVLGAVKQRAFRDDLYYRLGAFPIRLPPLRERLEDIPLLADHFLVAAGERHQKRARGIAPTAMELFTRFDWPGNVRELQNEIERAITLAVDGDIIEPMHLSQKVRTADVATRPAGEVQQAARAEQIRRTNTDLREARTAFEVDFIRKVLAEQGGNVSRAAQALGISRVALQKKMKEHGLR